MKVYHGDIISCDAQDNTYQYLVEDNGKIVYLGDDLPDIFQKLQVVEFCGAIIPSFVDAHIHFASYALFSSTTDIKSAESIDEIISKLKDYDTKVQPKFILSFGASAHSVKEKRLPTRLELDAVSINKAVVIICYDGHSLVINTKMRSMLPSNLHNLRGFDSESGYITMDAYLKCVDFITGKVPLPKLFENLRDAYDRLAAAGIGMIHAVEGVGFTLDLDVTISSLMAKGQDAFQTRIFFQTDDIKKIKKRKLTRVGGCFAAQIDGCFGCCDAAISGVYANDATNSGILYRTENEVMEFMKSAHNAGLQVALHCIGDRATEIFINAVEAAQAQNYCADHRHTIIHGDLLTDNQRQRIVKNNIYLVRQPYFLTWNLEPDEYYHHILGERANEMGQYRHELDMGMQIAGSSDGPVTNPEPLQAIHSLVNQRNISQRISVQEALKIFTINGARITFDDLQRGTLEIGKIADMVILDKNPLTIQPELIRDIVVQETILAGVTYTSKKSISAVIKKALSKNKLKI